MGDTNAPNPRAENIQFLLTMNYFKENHFLLTLIYNKSRTTQINFDLGSQFNLPRGQESRYYDKREQKIYRFLVFLEFFLIIS